MLNDAVQNSFNGTLNVTRSTVSDNHPPATGQSIGGGLYAVGGGTGKITVTSSKAEGPKGALGAGTYQASVVLTTIYAQGQTVEVTVWIAQGIGPVKTQVLIRAPGGTGLTTNELLSFTKAVSAIGDGS